MWEHHYTSCVGPVRLVERLGLPWMLMGTGSPHFSTGCDWGWRSRVWVGTFPCSVASVRVGSVPKLLQQKPGGWAQADSVPLMCVFSSVPTLGPLPWSQGNAEAEGGSCRLSALASHRESSRLSPVRRLLRHSRLFLSFCADVALRASSLCHLQWVTDPGYCRPCPLVDPHRGTGRAYMDILPILGAEATASRAAGRL